MVTIPFILMIFSNMGNNMKINQFFPLMLWTDDKGAVAVEYAILISCIAAVIATSVSLLGGAAQSLYQQAVDNFPR